MTQPNGSENAPPNNRADGKQGAAEREFPRYLPLASLLADAESDAAKRYEAKKSGKPLGPLTGLSTLDKRIGGALEPGLHILHGSPGVGKTAFALQLAADCGCPCLYVSAEMFPLELLRRVTARVTGTYLDRFRSGEFAPDKAMELYREAVRESPGVSLLDCTENPALVEDILNFAVALRTANSSADHLLIIVDSVHSWAEGTATDTATEYDTLNLALAGLRGISKKLDCPILGIAERNRSSMQKGGQSAGAGTRKIEYGAATVIELHVGDDPKPDANGEIELEVRLSKNRQGAAGKPIPMFWHGALQRFREANSK